MADFLRLVLLFLAAVNPPAVTRSALLGGLAGDRLAPLIAGALAAVLAALAALAGERVMDLLDVEPASFRVAVGTVAAIAGGLAIVLGRAPGGTMPGEPGNAFFPLALPWIAGPAVLLVAVQSSVDDGTGESIAAAAIAVVVAVALLLPGVPRPAAALDGLARLAGALLLVLGAGLIVDGVLAV